MEKESNILLSMILLKELDSYDADKIKQAVQDKWGEAAVQEQEKEKKESNVSFFVINGMTVFISLIEAPIPGTEVLDTAMYQLFWKDRSEEGVAHAGHLILTIMNGGKDLIQENILLSEMAALIMANSPALGYYMGQRSLLIEPNIYMEMVNDMQAKKLPIYAWVYMGYRQENGKQSVFTYGLADFGKKEIEIVDSAYELEALLDMLYGMAHYVLAYDVTLNDGETIGMSETQKLKISISKGRYLEGETIKVDY